jgi:DNA-binding IclR family transcriptional regulator
MSSSARRALKVLEQIGAADRPLGVTDVARRLSLAPGTVFRSLDALVRSSYAERYQASARYVLGPAAMGLRHTVFMQFALRDVALPYLRQLASATGESASLIVPLGWYGLRIATARGTNEITNVPALGPIGPLARNYAARPLLAFAPDTDLARYQIWEKRVLKLSPVPNLAAGLRQIRESGLAREDGSARTAVALPVRHAGAALATLALEGPVSAEGGELAALREAVAAIAGIVASRPAAFAHPFGHLDPDNIVLEQSVAPAPRADAQLAGAETKRQFTPPKAAAAARDLSKIEGS